MSKVESLPNRNVRLATAMSKTAPVTGNVRSTFVNLSSVRASSSCYRQYKVKFYAGTVTYLN